jgi:hypothetical protein
MSVNKQNFLHWSDERLMQIYKKTLHSVKDTVWCGMPAFGIIKWYFFEESNCTVTMASE